MGVAVAFVIVMSVGMPIVISDSGEVQPPVNKMVDITGIPIEEIYIKPIDVVIALDSSGSMEDDAYGNNVGQDDPGSRWYNARAATIDFIQKLTDQDRCALFTFDDGIPIQLRSYEYMTNVNKNSFIADLYSVNCGGMTPFYDMMGEAINYSVTNFLDPNPNPNLLSASRNEFVIGLGDGESNQDDDWTPNCDWGTSMWCDEHGTGATKDGLLHAPPMTLTIGLCIEHDPEYPWAPYWSRTPPDPLFSDEYDIWNVADSSPMILHEEGGKYRENHTTGDDNVGHYYYTGEPSELLSVFEHIYDYILEICTFEYPPERTFDYHLSAGWNMISAPLIQNNTSIQTVLSSIEEKWNCIRTYDTLNAEWNINATFWPDQLNDIHSLDHKTGFWINITEPNVTLTVQGLEANNTNIPLYAGWNLVGYPTLNEAIDISDALWGTGADRVMVCDTSEPYNIKEVGPAYLMKPGEGYWVHVTSDTVWTINW